MTEAALPMDRDEVTPAAKPWEKVWQPVEEPALPKIDAPKPWERDWKATAVKPWERKWAAPKIEAEAPPADPVVSNDITDPKQIEAMAQAQGMGAVDYVKNIGAGMGERVMDIMGGFGDLLAATAPGPETGIKYPYGSGNVQADLQKASQEMHDTSLGYEPGTTWEDVKNSPASSFIPFAIEQGLVSAPDMAAAMTALPAYIAARTGELADERAGNNNAENATVNDLLAAMPAAAASALLDRIGGRAMFGLDEAAVQSLKQVPKEAVKAGAKEGVTEAAQEGIESTATTLGTEKGFDPAETGEQMVAGFVGGAPFGAGVRTAEATIERAANKTSRLPEEGTEGAAVETEYPPLQAPATQDDGGDVASPLRASPSSAISPSERALLRKSAMPDEDIDQMSREEIVAKVAEARAAQVAVSPEEVRAAARYASPSAIFHQPAQDTAQTEEALPEAPEAESADPKASASRMMQDYQTRKARDQQMDAEAEERVKAVSPELSTAVLRNVYEDSPSEPLARPEPVDTTPDAKAIAQRQIGQYQARKADVDQAVSQVQPELEGAVEASVAEDAAQDARVDDALGAPLKVAVQRSLYEDTKGDGSRLSPKRVELPEHIDAVADRVNTEPSEAQKAAGNYQHAHLKVGGLDIAIENPKGSTRSGTDPNGKAWSVEMPAHYGRIKKTEGADGDQLDVYVGENPKSKRVYVIDQKDMGTRRFDEHKAIMGVNSVSEARDLYAKAFSDGMGADRIGGITPMSVSEFKKWAASGNTKTPLAMGKPNVRLNDEGFPVDAKGKIKKPDSIMEFIARKGGVREETGELKSIGLTDRKTGFVVGAGPLVRARGMHPDKAREAAEEAGYLPENSTIADLYDALAQDASNGRQVFSQYDDDWQYAWRGEQGEEVRQAEEAKAADEGPDEAPEDDADQARRAIYTRLVEEDYAGTMGDDFSQRVARYALSGETFEDAVFYAYDEMRKEALATVPGMPDIPFFGDEDNDAFAGTSAEGSQSAETGGSARDDAGGESEAVGTGRDREVRGEGRPEGEIERGGEDRERGNRESQSERPPVVEAGADNKLQLVIPGAERASDATMAQRKADAALKPKVPQKEAGGLFSDERDQMDLVDMAKKPPAKEPPRKPEAEPEKPEEPKGKIEDFGETLHGARKHIVQRYRDALTDESIDIGAEPLSKSFPAPDYKALAEDGVAPEALAIIALMRDTIPTKPKKTWKLKQWVEQVRRLRVFANDILEAEKAGYKDFVVDTVLSKMAGDNYSPLRDLAMTAKAIAGIDPDKLTQAAKWRVEAGSFSMLRGQRFSPSKRFFYIKDDKKRHAERDGYYETEEEAIAKARELIRKAVAPKEGEAERKYTPVGVYQDRITKDIFVGFKGRREVIRIKSGFEDGKAAREYIAESRDEIQDKIDAMREGPILRRDKNDPRIGPNWREGDVTPESFAETFGFRGVQFGNYVEGPRRQADLNRAFDALMDLADAIGIPPRAISLEGKLGLAFGARGHGGKNAAAAHYEPGNVVINLTKEAGPGSLAHEWLHALDNYFGKQNASVRYISDSEKMGGTVRDEMFQAWTEVRRAIRRPGREGFLGRAVEMDKARTKDYWSTTIELAARSFERYIVDRLETKGAVNDYLANINLSGGAYPNEEEMKGGIAAAYDHLFDTLETEVTDTGEHRLYSAAPSGWDMADAGEPMPRLSDAEQRHVARIVQQVAGLDPSFMDQIVVPANAPGLLAWGKNEEGSTAAGFYASVRDAITLALDTASVRANKVAYHESFHRLQNLFLSEAERRILASELPRLRQIVLRNGEYSPETVSRMSRKEVEAESFGIWSDAMDRNGEAPFGVHIALRRAWGRIREMLRRIRNYLTGKGFKTSEDVFRAAKSGETRSRAPRALPTQADVSFSLVEKAPDKPLRRPRETLGDRLSANIAKASKALAATAKNKGSRYDRANSDDGESFGDYSTRKIVDYLDPVLKMQNSVGADLNDLSDSYLTARLAEGTIRHEIHQIDEKYVTPAIEELARVGATAEDLHNFMYAMHAPERNVVVGKRNPEDSDLFKAVTDPSIKGASGMSTNEAKKIISDLAKDREKFMGIRRAAAHMRAMLDDGLKAQLKAGLINKATYERLTTQWQHYVPLRAESDQDGTGGSFPSKSRGFDVRGDEFKGATGRFSKADNVVVYAINNAEQSIIRVEKNKAATAALRFINEFDPQGESIAQVYWSDDPEQLGDITKAPPVYKRVLDKDGKVTNRKVNAFQMKDDVVAAKVGGKVYYMQFADPKVGLALKKMTFSELGVALKMVKTVSNWQSLINTRANPAFIPINFLRDVQTGATIALSKDFSVPEIAKMVSNIPSAWGALWRDARGKRGDGKWDRVVADFKANGGKISFDQYDSIEDTMKRLQKDMHRLTSAGTAGKAWRSFVDLIKDLNDTIENGMRVVIFNAKVGQGATPKRAAFMARDLTVDFQKKGEITPSMNALYTFFNASVQGNYNFAKALYKSRKVKVAMGALLAAGFAQHLWNLAMAGEDDDGENAYQKMLRNEPWRFERSMVFFLPGSKKYITVPLGFGMNAFWHLGVQGGAVTTGDKGFLPATLDSTRVAFDAFNPLGSGGWVNMFLPSIIDPVWELGSNQDFSGKPIYPQENQYDPAPPPKSEQAFKSTSPVARWGAETLNKISGGSEILPGAIDVYPDSLEYLWGWFTGGVGRFASQTAESAQRAANLEFEPKKTPFVRSFYGEVDNQGKRSEYFAQREKVQFVKGKVKEFGEAGDEEGLNEFISDNRQDYDAIRAFDATEKQRKKLNKQRRAIEKQQPENAKALLEELDKRELELMNQARKQYFELRGT